MSTQRNNLLGKFDVGVVIPAVEGRADNVNKVIEALSNQTVAPEEILVIGDGFDPYGELNIHSRSVVSTYPISKHRPGLEQPRNVGVKQLSNKCNYVWFLDSDVVPVDTALEAYRHAFNKATAIPRVFIGPYDWLPQGKGPELGVRNDPRWDMFDQSYSHTWTQGHLGVALGCFSGNLVWPIREFKRVGGFWSNLHMGRCEDGELGIRASAMQVPMTLVKEARGFHLWHEGCDPFTGGPMPTAQKLKANERDVPLINERHPYVEGEGLIVTDYDGKRFEFTCDGCGNLVNTGESWSHSADCTGVPHL